MIKSRSEGSQALRKVLSFTLRHWSSHKGLVATVAGGMTLATLTEVVVPVFAGRLVDALTQGRSHVNEAVFAFLAMPVLGLLMIGVRHVAWVSIVPLTLN